MHETSIKNRLTNAGKTIHDSHYNKIRDGIRNLQNYSYPYGDDRLRQTSDFNTVRSKVSAIKTLIDNYKSATFYPSKDMSGLNGMISDLNDVIDDWNREINSTRLETYTDYSSYPYTQRTRTVRKYPEEQPISKL